MVRKVAEEGQQIAPFLLKCYEMVDDESTNALISWGTNYDSFVIWNEVDFSTHLLPNYFKHNTFSSFVRQLNIYGFRKIETDRYEFANDWFIKGETHLLNNIVRRKNIQGVFQSKPSQKSTKDANVHQEEKNLVLWREVETLKTDKNRLMQELITLRQHQQSSQSKMLLVGEQLKGMEKNQQQMLSFIAMAMQNPDFLVKLLQPKEKNWRMSESGKTVLEEVIEDEEVIASDGTIVRYQPPTAGSGEPLRVPSLDSQNLLELDSSPDDLEDLVKNSVFGTLDGKMSASGNHMPLVLPDEPDEMDQLLLSDPSIEDVNGGRFNTGDVVDTGNEEELVLDKHQPNNSDQLKSLTEERDEYQNKLMDMSALRSQLDNNWFW